MAGRFRQEMMRHLSQPRRKIKPQLLEAAKKKKWAIVRGDTVQVISRRHPEYGKQGAVMHVDRKKDRIVVEGVNLAKHRVKAEPERGIKAETIMKERSMHYSNVNLVDPVTGLPTRIYKKILDDGTKVRVAKKSGAVIPKPPVRIDRPIDRAVTESDTLDADVWEVTYVPEQSMPMEVDGPGTSR